MNYYEEELLSVQDGGKPYVVIPGYITSIVDGDTHYITASRLMQLYGVRPENCVIYEAPRGAGMVDHYHRVNKWKLQKIQLFPDYHGDYRLPEERAVALDPK